LATLLDLQPIKERRAELTVTPAIPLPDILRKSRRVNSRSTALVVSVLLDLSIIPSILDL
jgi:hypothetical protein